jgi:cytochrome d ubiquinol oxidase subunit II
MSIAWFWVLGIMLTAYAVLDGYDLGVGAVHLWLARGEQERRVSINAIGPVWNGNEVWLIAAGGMMVVSFPRVYASSFSGFYLALMLVLWLLILRGISIEFRSQFDHPMWRAFWDACFWIGSLLLTFLLGVALGNVLGGLPVARDGYFQGTFALLLNPFSILTGLLSTVTLVWHGTNYLQVKAEGGLLRRARRWSRTLWYIEAPLFLATTAVTLVRFERIRGNFVKYPAAFAFPMIALGGLVAGYFYCGSEKDRCAFRSSAALIVGLMGSAAASMFPDLLYSTLNPKYSLTVWNAASSPHALWTAFLANLIGMVAVGFYSFRLHRLFSGKVRTFHY